MEAVDIDGMDMRRLHCDTATWHVFARGTRRLVLFRDDPDFTTFLQCLAFALRASDCELWGYALMSNHYHLVLHGSSSQLATCMYHANRIYARCHNEKYNLGGHVFDGPYQAYRVPTSRLTMWTLAYVFLNPVKAGLCLLPEDYAWSGYRSFLGRKGSPLGVQSSSFMNRVDLPLKRAWERFHECVRLEMKRPQKQVAARPAMAEVHLSQFQWLLEHAKESLTLLAGEDPLEVAVFWAKQCGIAPRFVAQSLGTKDCRGIRQMLRRITARISKNPLLAHLATVP